MIEMLVSKRKSRISRIVRPFDRRNVSDLLEQLGVYIHTPVDTREGIFFKRDDLFIPFGAGGVNGGKLRQGAFLLAEAKERGFQRVLTGCSIQSPQAPMVAAVAKHFGMKCTILYGGTRMELVEQRHMPRLAKHFGAKFHFAKSGRASVLLHEARKIQGPGDMIVMYGMNSKDPKHLVAFYESTAQQVQNLPDNLQHLAVTCGSGITASGILYGLQKYNKQVTHVWLLGTAPNREKKVRQRLVDLSFQTGVNCRNYPFNYIDLFAQGMTYEKKIADITCGDISFHRHYEAKTFPWFRDKTGGRRCFWIVGAEPELLKNVNS